MEFTVPDFQGLTSEAFTSVRDEFQARMAKEGQRLVQQYITAHPEVHPLRVLPLYRMDEREDGVFTATVSVMVR